MGQYSLGELLLEVREKALREGNRDLYSLVVDTARVALNENPQARHDEGLRRVADSSAMLVVVDNHWERAAPSCLCCEQSEARSRAAGQ